MSPYHSLKRPIVVPLDAPAIVVDRDVSVFELRTDKVQELQIVPDRRAVPLLIDLTLKVPSE